MKKKCNDHAAQWERQGEWLAKLGSHKKTLEAQGIQGWDLLEAMATLSLEHKVATSKNRCSQCWHDQSNCICSQLAPIEFGEQILSPKVKILILMHSKECLCAGNSAKLLLQLLPNQTELYIFGKTGEVDRLFQEVSVDRKRTMILWPGKTAISIPQFLELANKQQSTTEATTFSSTASTCQGKMIRAIVLDGTYTQARNMHKSLRKRWGKDLPVAVALRPESGSVFHRAQKNYGKAHQQQEAFVQRISTAEACGLLLTELGAETRVQGSILQAVIANNDALAHVRRATSNNS